MYLRQACREDIMIDMMSPETRADRTLFDNGDDTVLTSEVSTQTSNMKELQSRAESSALSAKVSRLMNSLKGASAPTEESEPSDGSEPAEEE